MNTILLLEDEATLRRSIQFKLEKEGYHVISCDTIQNARMQFKSAAIGLILCDIMLSDGSGLDFCAYIREELQNDVQFIFLTAMDTELDIVMGYETGADDYITKPFSLAILMSKINNIFKRIEKNSRSEAAEQKNADGNFIDDNTVAVNILRLREKINDSEEKRIIKNIRGMGYVWDLEVE